MNQLIDRILLEFRNCFKRKKTWQWFVVVLIGFMLRTDNRGVTSIISALRLKPRLYHNILHFFRSSAYQIGSLPKKWIRTAVKYSEIVRINGHVIILGDHSKVSKEGLRMPGIQTMHQDSQNSGKPSFIEGHNFGQVSAVITNGNVSRSLPLVTQLQASPKKIPGTKAKDGKSLVSQMITLTNQAAKAIGEPVYAALDAYFSSEVAWSAADATVTDVGIKLVEIITRAQTNTVAFKEPEPSHTTKRGRPKKYGNRTVLYDLFADTSRFTQTNMVLYGKPTKVKYLCLDLLWKPVKRLVRFVLVMTDSGNCVLMSSDLGLDPESIIAIYALRFKIETSFDEQKNDMGGFAYHFWTAALPKRKKWKPVALPSDENSLNRIAKAKQAMDAFVCLSTIATGLLTVIAFSHNREIWKHYPGWVRTLRSVIPTIATVKLSLSHVFHTCLPDLTPFASFSFIEALIRKDVFLYKNVA